LIVAPPQTENQLVSYIESLHGHAVLSESPIAWVKRFRSDV